MAKTKVQPIPKTKAKKTDTTKVTTDDTPSVMFGQDDKIVTPTVEPITFGQSDKVVEPTITPTQTETPEPERLTFLQAWRKYLIPADPAKRWQPEGDALPSYTDGVADIYDPSQPPMEGGGVYDPMMDIFLAEKTALKIPLKAMGHLITRINKFLTAVSPVPEMMKNTATLNPNVLEGMVSSIWEARIALVPKPGYAKDMRTLGETMAEDWYEPVAGEEAPWWYAPLMDVSFETLLFSAAAAKRANMASQSAYSNAKLTSFEIKSAKRIFSADALAKVKPSAVRGMLAKEMALKTLTKVEKAKLLELGYKPAAVQQMSALEIDYILQRPPLDVTARGLTPGAKVAIAKMTESLKAKGRFKYRVDDTLMEVRDPVRPGVKHKVVSGTGKGRRVSRKTFIKLAKSQGVEATEKELIEGTAAIPPKQNTWYERIFSAKEFVADDVIFPNYQPPQITPYDYRHLLNSLSQNNAISLAQKQDTGVALIKVMDGVMPSGIEVSLLEKQYGTTFAKALLSKRTPGTKVVTSLIDVANAPRSLLASMDLSFPLRQGSMLLPGHPIQWSKSFGQMMKSAIPFKGEQYADDLANIALSSRYAGLRRNAGLDITEWGTATLSTREESALSTLAERIPIIGRGVKWSNRTYTTMSNQLRINVFDSTARNWERVGMSWADNPEAYTKLASFLNHATGRGTIPKSWEAQVPLLNAAFFSPKFQISRFQVPIDAIGSINNAPIRKLIAKDLVAYVTAGTGAMALLALDPENKVELDPRASSFGKVKRGNTQYDFFGGYAQIARLVAQGITGTAKTAGGIQEADRLKIIGRFLRTKLSPAGAGAVDTLSGETLMGDELSLTATSLEEQLWKRTAPMVWQDIYDAIQYQGFDWQLPVTSISAIFGVGANSWQPSKWELLSREQDTLAMETHGKGWGELSDIQQMLLQVDNQLLANLEREAAYESTVFPFLEEMREQQLRAGYDVERTLPKPVLDEMERLKIRVGMLPRTWGQWTLNNNRYNRYKSLLAYELADRLPALLESEGWSTETKQTQIQLMEAEIQVAKILARTTLRTEVYGGTEDYKDYEDYGGTEDLDLPPQLDFPAGYTPEPPAAPPVAEPVTFGQNDEIITEPATGIDIDKIVQIESSGRADAVSPVGARGLMQFMKPTWDEITKKMGKDWSFDEAFDPGKNRQVGVYYMNVEIPRLLKSYGIPDTTETRLGAYNWGIGNLQDAYEEYGDGWIEHAPEETQNYIKKYRTK